MGKLLNLLIDGLVSMFRHFIVSIFMHILLLRLRVMRFGFGLRSFLIKILGFKRADVCSRCTRVKLYTSVSGASLLVGSWIKRANRSEHTSWSCTTSCNNTWIERCSSPWSYSLSGGSYPSDTSRSYPR